MSIELELDKKWEKLINDENILVDDKDIINTGFFTLKTTYTTPVFKFQICISLQLG